MSKPKDLVNYVVIGSRYQVMNEEGKPMPEFGVGVFRSGIQLELARELYVALVTKQLGGPLSWNGDAKRLDRAAELAEIAFALTEVFLDEVDKHFRRPPPPPPEENGDEDLIKIRRR